MKNSFIKGASYLLLGIRLILSKELRQFIYIPILVNLLVFSLLTYFLGGYLLSYITHLNFPLPSWLINAIKWLLVFLFATTALFIMSTSFVLITNLIASPFYSFLVDKTEKKLCLPTYPSIATGVFHLIKLVINVILRELKKLASFTPFLLIPSLLFIFPLTTLLSPFAWFMTMAWISSIQFVDITADNHSHSLTETLTLAKQNFKTMLGFGCVIALSINVPILNLLVPPAAVAGGCKLWHDIINIASSLEEF